MFVPRQQPAILAITCYRLCNVLMNDVTKAGKRVLEGFYLQGEGLQNTISKIEGNLVSVYGLNEMNQFEGSNSIIPFHLNQSGRYLFIAARDDKFYNMTGVQNHVKKLAKDWQMEERCAHIYFLTEEFLVFSLKVWTNS